MADRDEEFEQWFDKQPGHKEIRVALGLLTSRKLSPAQALFEIDPTAYEQKWANWRAQILDEALTKRVPPRVGQDNRRRFLDLQKRVSSGCVVPFVGAGLSIPCKMPGWTSFLLQLGGKALVDPLVKKGRYEDAATRVLERLKEHGFRERYRSKFTLRGPVAGAVQELPSVAKGSVITTNFDGVLEKVFGHALNPVFQGRSSNDFCRCVASGEQSLLKLHGDIHVSDSRVLTVEEYDAAYGPKGTPDYSLPIPKGLRALFSGSTLLFLGCSLTTDRTLDVFRHIIKIEGGDYLPFHYAILPWPGACTAHRDHPYRSS